MKDEDLDRAILARNYRRRAKEMLEQAETSYLEVMIGSGPKDYGYLSNMVPVDACRAAAIRSLRDFILEQEAVLNVFRQQCADLMWGFDNLFMAARIWNDFVRNFDIAFAAEEIEATSARPGKYRWRSGTATLWTQFGGAPERGRVMMGHVGIEGPAERVGQIVEFLITNASYKATSPGRRAFI